MGIFLIAAPPLHANRAELTVYVASSTETAFADIKTLFLKNHDITLNLHSAASSTLAKQIKNGAKCDLVLMASTKWMSFLSSESLIESKTIFSLLSNKLALIAPLNSTLSGSFSHILNTATRIVIADHSHVPSGQYAKEFLDSIQLWDLVNTKAILAPNARASLIWVELGFGDVGIVYASDAKNSKKIRLINILPTPKSQQIIYPLAICKQSQHADAQKAYKLIREKYRYVFAQHGFLLP